MTKKPTQQEKILKVLQELAAGIVRVPQNYLKRCPEGWAVSARYFKHVLYISECNGRISELRDKGFVVEPLEEKDEYGFCYHRLMPKQGVLL